MIKICLKCNTEYDTKTNELNKKTKNRKFCSQSCSASFNNKLKKINRSDEEKQLLKEKNKRVWLNKINTLGGIDNWSKKIGEKTRGKYKDEIDNIYQLSSRTIQKLTGRLKLKCSVCGWDKSTCDIHHINGRKINDCHNHKNLTVLCPNCHRLVHNKIIDKDQLKTLDEILPDNWKEFYYG